MNTRTILVTLSILAVQPACDDYKPARWTSLQCWENAHGPICAGVLDGEDIVVVAPSMLAEAIEDGRMIPIPSPECAVGGDWSTIQCVESSSSGTVGCFGELDGVLVPSPDPCLDPPAGQFVILDGLYASPVNRSMFDGLAILGWLG